MTADSLNAHLARGGRVQMTTYSISRVYDRSHAGYFSRNDKGELFVRAGKRRLCLGREDRPFVAIRLI